MDPVTTSAIIGGGVALGGTAANILMSKKRRQEQYSREDNAVQRRAKDMEAAGLSKTLAAGSAAQAQTQQAPNTSGFSDAGKAIGNIPAAKAQNALMTANAAKAAADAEATGFSNHLSRVYQTWLHSPSFGRGEAPGHTNAQNVKDGYTQDMEQKLISTNFFNHYGLPNQPGVLQSQTGQILMLNNAWANMDPEERKQFLTAYGATTLADIAGKLLGGAASGFGGKMGTGGATNLLVRPKFRGAP
nr:MAG: DNA pilot protein [Microvirus sp.]